MGIDEHKNRSAKIMATEIFQGVERKNYVKKLCDKNKVSQQEFVRAAGYMTNLSRPTLEKAYKGSTDLDYDVIEKLAWFFGVETKEVLESVI